MKFRNETLQVLRNACQISETVIFNREKLGKIVVMDEAKTVILAWDLEGKEKEIPEFVIYNLPELLNVIDFFEKTKDEYDIIFKEEDDYLLIKSKTTQVKYFFTEKNIIKDRMPPADAIELSSTEASFKITKAQMSKILAAANTLVAKNVVFKIKKGSIICEIKDSDNPSANSFQMIISKNNVDGDDDSFAFKRESMTILNSDFDFYISSQGIARIVATGDYKGLIYNLTVVVN